MRNKLASIAMTDTGRVREHNEDAIAHDQDIGLFVLADGWMRTAGALMNGFSVS